MVYAESIFVDSYSVLSADYSGCTSEAAANDSVASKYTTICNVRGGSNIGRGSLGTDTNFQNCKFFTPKPKSKK